MAEPMSPDDREFVEFLATCRGQQHEWVAGVDCGDPAVVSVRCRLCGLEMDYRPAAFGVVTGLEPDE